VPWPRWSRSRCSAPRCSRLVPRIIQTCTRFSTPARRCCRACSRCSAGRWARRTGRPLSKWLATSFAATSLLEILHALVSVEWSGMLAPIAAAQGFLRPAAWPPTAHLLPIGIGLALWQARRGGDGVLGHAVAAAGIGPASSSPSSGRRSTGRLFAGNHASCLDPGTAAVGRGSGGQLGGCTAGTAYRGRWPGWPRRCFSASSTRNAPNS
jgi:hypothetical protein